MKISVVQEYKKLLKSGSNEEFFDLILHRPLAYLVVKALQPLPVSANHVTGFSVLISFAAAYFLAGSGTLFIAGILIFIGNVLDCADGQLARLRGATSQYGRIVDGFGDYASLVAIFLGIALWHPPFAISPLLWYALVATTMFSFGWQSSLVDYYRNEYSFRLSGRINFAREEYEQAMLELKKEELASKNFIKRFSLKSYASYLAYQQKNDRTSSREETIPAAEYVKSNATLFKLWLLNGTATPRFLLMIFCFMDRLDFLAVYVLTIGMVWTIALLFFQKRTLSRLQKTFA